MWPHIQFVVFNHSVSTFTNKTYMPNPAKCFINDEIDGSNILAWIAIKRINSLSSLDILTPKKGAILVTR